MQTNRHHTKQNLLAVKTYVQSSTRVEDGDINSGWGDLEGWASRKVVENSAP